MIRDAHIDEDRCNRFCLQNLPNKNGDFFP